MEAKLQAQVRGLTRDVGALREALRQEEKKRERLAAAAKAAEEARAGAEAQLKQLRYVNTKLEQERRSAKDKAEATAAQSRSGLEALRGRLAEVERSVHRRSVEAQRAVQRLHSLVQGVQAAAMPLAVAAAAAAPAAAPPALKSPLPGGGRRPAAAQHAAAPEVLHRHFAQVFGGLAQLADLFAGGSGGDGAEGAAVANPAPLLLTAPDGSRKAVHWQDQNCASSAASPASSASLGSAADGTCSGGAGVAAAASAASREARLAAEVQRLRAALAESRQRAAASEAKAAAASSAAAPASSGRVEAAMRQLDAVVPQYRAAAQALQGQVATLRDKLVAAGRERAALQDEVAKWRGLAQRHEAAFAEAAAKLHSRDAASLAASTQQQSQAAQISEELETARRRCADLAGRLQEAQAELSQAQAALGAKEKQVAAQQAAIRRLEATVQEQRADIKAALDLVAGRPTGAAADGGSGGGLTQGLEPLPADAAAPAVDEYSSGEYLDGCLSGWEAAGPLTDDQFGDLGLGLASAAPGGFDPSSWDAAGGFAAGSFAASASGTVDPLASLLDAATAAADAATAWAGSYDTAAAAAGPAGDWGQCGDPLAGPDAMDGWSIPAVGGSRQGSPLKAGGRGSPSKRAGAGGGSKQAGSRGQPAGASLQGSQAAVPSLTAVESDIEGLESALRAALGDLSF